MEKISKSIRVNISKSKEIGQAIRRYQVRPEFLQRPFLTIEAESELKHRAIFYAVAICHQTYNLAMPGINLYGWDVLEHVFLNMLLMEDELLKPGFCKDKSVDQLAIHLRKRFQTNTEPASCSLDRLEERAGLLLDLDEKLGKNHQDSLFHLMKKSGSKLIYDGTGLYEVLDDFEAFSDPLRKKSSFLIKLLLDAGLFSISDPENYIPIMDYHMQRVLLRTGCVEIEDNSLAEKLRNRTPIPDDLPIREVCIESMRLIAKESGHSIAVMNDFFWPLGRSCCNENPLCQAGVCEKTPCTLTQLITLEHPHSSCILENACKGKNEATYREFWQPVVNTHYY